VGTGNYNENTAKLYTDIGLLTSDHAIGEDATMLFNEITGYSVSPRFRELVVAPNNMKQRLVDLIRREKEHAIQGRPARIVAKMNSLSNQEMVDELYAASQAGVRIDLIVRGVCCLRPGVPGLSETITVRSIVDRYLEHARLLCVDNGGQREVWLSSADWMTRNLTRRVEALCPVKSERLQNRVVRILDMQLGDNVKARILQPNGSYTHVQGESVPFRSQFEAENIIAWQKAEHEIQGKDPKSF
jgi:polyphosphate kinase